MGECAVGEVAVGQWRRGYFIEAILDAFAGLAMGMPLRHAINTCSRGMVVSGGVMWVL